MTYLSINHDYPISRYLGAFDHVWNTFDRLSPVFDRFYQTARFEVDESNDGYSLTMALPGFKKTDVEVTLDQGYHLSVRAQKGDSRVERTVLLGTDIDTDSLQAKLEDGILTILVKKTERAKPRKVLID